VNGGIQWVLGLAMLLISAYAAAQEAPRGDPAAGKQLFDAKACYSCHGYVGQGSREGPRLAPPMPFPAFLAQLREPRAIMPPYKEAILSDQQAADIVAYLASLPRSPDPKSIPLLQQ
jgi:ubiquinol-cytochrome c reductase cytochrome c subunit